MFVAKLCRKLIGWKVDWWDLCWNLNFCVGISELFSNGQNHQNVHLRNRQNSRKKTTGKICCPAVSKPHLKFPKKLHKNSLEKFHLLLTHWIRMKWLRKKCVGVAEVLCCVFMRSFLMQFFLSPLECRMNLLWFLEAC